MKNRSILDRLFPKKYDFFNSLGRQAQINALSISALNSWLKEGKDGDADVLERCGKEADEVRLSLERDLVEAFSTPVERGDIYLLSVDMDKVIDYARSTLHSMRAFGVESDGIIRSMVDELNSGVNGFYEAVKYLKSDPAKSEQLIPAMRKTHAAVEKLYIDGMAALFQSGDPMHALKLREVYHHIKDASSNLDYSVDTLHSIIVGLI
ncbi:DUF47 domain-containing protein [Papillibacter cinnamivorans]|uniref:Phosphate transport regulator (Distant homolog of PhoU) n=1 Tax=Papillibacter cinnamivorans DSM 12816 TaxID=1122930 RepID=A0A1W2CPJ9_9FIRM|nr:DUF47 family protein [Papillibacter cinnamivorans]SMC86802.1 hypothetical protein SAMN02745168_0120 [Papillibacter cinnamivorans DSM 12816]